MADCINYLLLFMQMNLMRDAGLRVPRHTKRENDPSRSSSPASTLFPPSPSWCMMDLVSFDLGRRSNDDCHGGSVRQWRHCVIFMLEAPLGYANEASAIGWSVFLSISDFRLANLCPSLFPSFSVCASSSVSLSVRLSYRLCLSVIPWSFLVCPSLFPYFSVSYVAS